MRSLAADFGEKISMLLDVPRSAATRVLIDYSNSRGDCYIKVSPQCQQRDNERLFCKKAQPSRTLPEGCQADLAFRGTAPSRDVHFETRPYLLLFALPYF